MTYRIVSNYTEIGEFDHVNRALAFALEESERFDDVIVIEADGVEAYMVRHGRAFRLGRPVSRKSANPGPVVAERQRPPLVYPGDVGTVESLPSISILDDESTTNPEGN